jgi:predicted phage-related endonuclease
MALTPEQHARRDGKIGASFLPYLMAGNEAKILAEWRRLVGDPDYVEEDLSDEWLPSFGSFIEPFALDWHQKKTGHEIIDRGVWVNHPELDFIGATLDGRRPFDNRVLDCKAPGRWRILQDVLDMYPSQMVIQKDCAKAASAALIVVHGGEEPVEHELTWDLAYENEVWSRVNWFWQRVESLQAPCAIPAAAAPVPAIRQVDMSTSNSWCTFAEGWLATKAAAKANKDAAEGIKSLIEADVARAFGHGICASRSKTGAITIRPTKDAR